MPWPENIETAIAVEGIVRENGAVPAAIAVLDGRIRVGLGREDELVFWVRIAEMAVDVVSIEEALTLLSQMHDQAAKAG